MCGIRVGDTLPERRISSVSPDHIKMVALILRDSNPIHFDLDAVARAGLGDREVSQGGATMAYVLDLLAEWAGSRSALRTISCSFRANVLAGDDVTLSGEVTEVSAHQRGRLVNCAIWAALPDGRRALQGTATVLISGRSPEGEERQ
jgi:acyl dehydratase